MPAFGKSLFGNFQSSLEQARASVLQLEQALFQKYLPLKKTRGPAVMEQVWFTVF